MALTYERKPFDPLTPADPGFYCDKQRETVTLKFEVAGREVSTSDIIGFSKSTPDPEIPFFLSDRPHCVIDSLYSMQFTADDQFASDALAAVASDAVFSIEIVHYAADVQYGQDVDQSDITGTVLATISGGRGPGEIVDVTNTAGYAPSLGQGDYLTARVVGDPSFIRELVLVTRFSSDLGQ